MTRITPWLVRGLLAALGLAVVLVAGVFAAQAYVGSDDFRSRAEKEAAAALGVDVRLGRVSVDLWPVPAVAVTDAQVLTKPVLTLGRVEVRPALLPLLQGRVELSTVLLYRAVLAQPGLDALLAAQQARAQKQSADPAPAPGETTTPVAWLVRRAVVEDLTWLNAQGDSVTVNANLRWHADSLPDEVLVNVVQGQFAGLGGLQGSVLTLGRQGEVWAVALTLGQGADKTASAVKEVANGVKGGAPGGSIKGQIELHNVAPTAPGKDGKADKGGFSLKGQLDTQGVDVARFGGARGGPLSGRLEANTTLTARAADVAGLVQGLQTQSKFTVKGAVLHGLDLAKAVTTVGLSRGGETRLDVLAGQVTTRGRAVQITNLVASSGVLSATGNVAMTPNRALSGRIQVALGESALAGAVGVPLQVGGTLDAPEVSLSRAALIGAAIGTAMMPGAGTSAGASLGDRVGDKFKHLFGK